MSMETFGLSVEEMAECFFQKLEDEGPPQVRKTVRWSLVLGDTY